MTFPSLKYNFFLGDWMKKSLLKNVKTLATFSDCFEVKATTEETISSLVKRVPFFDTCIFCLKCQRTKWMKKFSKQLSYKPF